MAILKRILRLTFRFPLQSGLSLAMAVTCTVLVLVLPGVTMRFVDVIIGQKRPDLIIPTASVGIGAILLRQLLFTLRTYYNNSLELKLTHLIRVELYDKLQRLPVKWFDSNSSGEIMSRVANDVPTANRIMIEGVDQAIAAILQFLIVVGYMCWLSWQLTLVTLIPLPFIAVLTTWWSRRSEPMWRESSEATSALNAILHDNLSGIRQIKAYTVEPQALETFDKASRKVGEKTMTVMRGQALVWPGVSFIAESGIILMVAFGAHWVLADQLSKGAVISFLVAWGFLFDPISRINTLSQTFTKGIVSAERVFKILDTPDEANLTEGIRPERMTGHVRFENVSFSYSEEAPTINDLTLEAQPGETVALVGATGAGKSTVLNLLTRFYDPTSGHILIDGVPLDTISKEWLRDQLGYVTQESFLFNTTLRENLLLAKHDASDDEIWAALEAANAAGFVRASPDGLATVAGERGGRFSGGEKQRLSIARALLKNPPLLLLDEATSALDNKTERLVQEALENLRSDRTCFVIAHRLSTVQKADRICVLHHGTLVEQGTHAELIRLGGSYAKLCEATFANDPRPAA
ncbi:ABC transporter ATP-binding protein [Luteolibacter yonseiensis]|uniref:ABC transporter ATP-binding protein n=1 Tax=Luteolibacter yonseiensis TaxID=1144680 RepID=A0A934VDH3_9BACT|nr:ABC transporter ATP-binding protein [Luteolibacter yonseiensis]MBK1817569.1 ABC transporter ATP-binding protein [Luteolibacter yonseiensis]